MKWNVFYLADRMSEYIGHIFLCDIPLLNMEKVIIISNHSCIYAVMKLTYQRKQSEFVTRMHSKCVRLNLMLDQRSSGHQESYGWELYFVYSLSTNIFEWSISYVCRSVLFNIRSFYKLMPPLMHNDQRYSRKSKSSCWRLPHPKWMLSVWPRRGVSVSRA